MSLFWFNSTTQETGKWKVSTTAVTSQDYSSPTTDTLWTPQATGDINGDGKTDVIWRNTSTGQVMFWYMNNGNFTNSEVCNITVADQAWKICGTGKFNTDSNVDLVWRNYSTGDNLVWYMNGSNYTSDASISNVADLNWQIAAVGDFNGDGKPDLFWRYASASGTDANKTAVWYMNNTTPTSQPYCTSSPTQDWLVAGAEDVDGDGKAEVIWYNPTTSQISVWKLNGGTVTSTLFTISNVSGWKALAPFIY